MRLATKVFGHTYEFKSLREVMAKANEEKSGDMLAGIAAESAEERVAAKVVLSEITLNDIRNTPAVPYEEDEVTRIIQDSLNETIFSEMKSWTVGELREWLLSEKTTEAMIRRASRGLTSEMIAAVTNSWERLTHLCATGKSAVTAQCNKTIGSGTSPQDFSHNTTDDPKGVIASVWGLSVGLRRT